MAKSDDTLPPLPRSPRVPASCEPKTPKSEPSPERQAAFSRGISAESLAAAWLVGKGYRILARRFRCAAGEIDIVAGRRQTVIFVEVKARASFDEAAESVTPRQRSRIATAAEIWLANNPKIDVSGFALRRHPDRAGQAAAAYSRRVRDVSPEVANGTSVRDRPPGASQTDKRSAGRRTGRPDRECGRRPDRDRRRRS